MIRRLRAGGNGVVWLATHAAMDAETVIKFPLRWVRGGPDDQLERETRSLVAFSNRHPNIVNILDVGDSRGRRFVVMQYMRNGSLQDFCGDSPRGEGTGAEVLQSLAWLNGVADALDYVHTQGLVHRDVKPANVLLDDSFSAYLADFGIATGGGLVAPANEKPLENPGFVVGSLPYIAPELLTGSPSTPASDQFALAVTVYEFALGSVPFAGERAAQVLEAQHETIRRWKESQSIPGLCGPVGAVLSRALGFDPKQRFASCSMLAAELTGVWRPLAPPPTERRFRSGDTQQAVPSTVRAPAAPAKPEGSKRPPPNPQNRKPDAARKKVRLNRLLHEDDTDRDAPRGTL